MRAHGKVNLIGVAIVAAIAGGLYWVIMLSPVYLDNLDIKDAVASSYNESGRQRNNEVLRRRIMEVAKRIGHHEADDGYGNITTKVGLGLTDEQIIIERDEVAKTILIRVEYEQEVQLKPLTRIKVVRFATEKAGPIPE